MFCESVEIMDLSRENVEYRRAAIRMGLLAAMPMRTYAVYCAIRSFRVGSSWVVLVSQRSVGALAGVGRQRVNLHISKLKKMGLLETVKPTSEGLRASGVLGYVLGRSGVLELTPGSVSFGGYFLDEITARAYREALGLAASRGVAFEEMPFEDLWAILKRHLNLSSGS